MLTGNGDWELWTVACGLGGGVGWACTIWHKTQKTEKNEKGHTEERDDPMYAQPPNVTKAFWPFRPWEYNSNHYYYVTTVTGLLDSFHDVGRF